MKHIAATATLCIGQTDATQIYTLTFLQQAICAHAGCGHCAHCEMIRMRTHHHIVWITPEKKYTLDILEPITETIGFALEADEHVFFVLEKAELLTTACANSLLKMVEEPPAGYHFLFLATQAQLVLPTIRSRCHIVYAKQEHTVQTPHFLRHFMEHSSWPTIFLKDLNESPEDYEVPAHIDMLLKYWVEKAKEALLTDDKKMKTNSQRMITLLQRTTQTLPMSGSGKIFWRNLFLQKEQELSHENA